MGTPLPVSEYKKEDGTPYFSGTEWEFIDALKSAQNTGGPPTILVFRRREIPEFPISLLDEELQEKQLQWARVLKFFNYFRNPDGSLLGSIIKYNITEFGDLLDRQLQKIFRDLLEKTGPIGSDLTITSVMAPKRVNPLSGHPVLTPKDPPSPVFTGGFHVSFSIGHNREGSYPINLNRLELELIRFEDDPQSRYAYQIDGAEIIGAGMTTPQVFKVSIFGNRVAPARWVVNTKDGTFVKSKSANFFDTDEPRVFKFSPDDKEDEEILCAVLAQERGLYQLRFVFYYSVAGVDKRQATEIINVYSDE